MSADTITSSYRYEHFRLRHMLADLRFDPRGPRPGDQMHELRLATVDPGGVVELGQSDRPQLLVFGSNTCPMTAAAARPLRRLHDEFGDRIRFVVVQVREAHPGASLGQAETMDEKADQARHLGELFGDGRILFRAIWASDERGLRAALAAAAAGRSPRRTESRRMAAPLLASMGYIDGALRTAGNGAARDLALAAPPMLVAGKLASLFAWMPRHRRGHAVATAVGLLLVLAAWWLLR